MLRCTRPISADCAIFRRESFWKYTDQQAAAGSTFRRPTHLRSTAPVEPTPSANGPVARYATKCRLPWQQRPVSRRVVAHIISKETDALNYLILSQRASINRHVVLDRTDANSVLVDRLSSSNQLYVTEKKPRSLVATDAAVLLRNGQHASVRLARLCDRR